jgi:ADP-ribosylglycohydrolase
MNGRADRIAGVILGTAVGDALGLPREGLSARRAARMFGPPPLRHRFLFGRGMVSDDTEHACLVGQSLLRQPDDSTTFARDLARRLRFWLLGLPAGLGSATLRSILKLWVGFSTDHSGVRSAGNGPAMRAALLGACLGHEPERLRSFVRASTRLTHTDPRAERGAWLVATAAHYGAVQGPRGLNRRALLQAARAAWDEPDAEWERLLTMIESHLEQGAEPARFAEALGLRRGVSGYIYHTVPVAVYCWLRSPGDFRRAVEEVIALGGDADTTGAVVGALAGGTVGAGGIPRKWVDGLLEWPRSVGWMRALARRLAEQFPGDGVPAPRVPRTPPGALLTHPKGVQEQSARRASPEPNLGRGELIKPRVESAEPGARGRGPLPLFWPGLVPRNLLFLLVVLLHALRRLLPPY